MTKGYLHNHTSVHMMMYHFIWIPARRKKVLVGKIRDRADQLIRQKAKQLSCVILALEIMPDHIHLFIQGNPIYAPNRIIGQIKGYTSKILRDEFPILRRIPSLWTRSYWVSTAGNVSNKTIQKYIEEQTKNATHERNPIVPEQ